MAAPLGQPPTQHARRCRDRTSPWCCSRLHGLLLRSYVAVLQTDPGFNPKNMLVAATVLPSLKYADHARRSAFYAGVLEEVKALPGVEDAAYANFAPLTIRGGFVLVTPEGAPPLTPETFPRYVVSDRVVTPGYLETLGVPLIGGRHLDERDMADSSAPAVGGTVVNQTMAARYWPDGGCRRQTIQDRRSPRHAVVDRDWCGRRHAADGLGRAAGG